jgi:hypothetical protein
MGRLESASGTNLGGRFCYEEAGGATGLGLVWLSEPRLDPGFRASKLFIHSACLRVLEIACCKIAPLLSRLRALLSWSSTKSRASVWPFVAFCQAL